MKIAICGSMSTSKKMCEAANTLREAGHEVILPHGAEKYASGEISVETSHESRENKIHNDLIKKHYEVIKNCDAMLAINEPKQGIAGYIGANTLMEVAFAHILNKHIFILNSFGDTLFGYDELMAVQPTILDGDVAKIEVN